MGARGPKSKFTGEACPNRECRSYGKAGQGNIAGNGTYETTNGTVRKYVCRSCGRTFSERSSTAFFDLRTNDAKVMMALKMLVKGMSYKAAADVLGSKPETVRNWARRAAEHHEEVNAALMDEMRVTKAELERLWASVRGDNAGEPEDPAPHAKRRPRRD